MVNEKKISLWQKFKNQSLFVKLVIISIVITIILNYLPKTPVEKPDICNCNIVFKDELPPVNVLEEIIDTKLVYYDDGKPLHIYDDIEEARRRCRLLWFDEIDKEFGGVYSGEDVLFFERNCKQKN